MKNVVDSINNAFYSRQVENNIIGHINHLLSGITDKEVLGLHKNLSDMSLKGMYDILDSLNISNDAKEHIVWQYYKNLIQDQRGLIDDSLFEKILSDHEKYKYVAIESIIVKIIKQGLLSDKQIKIVQNYFDNPEIDKQLLVLKASKLIESGVKLDMVQVASLLRIKAYEFLKYALDKEATSQEALLCFEKPKIGENNKKIKNLLYEMAKKLKKK